MHNRIIPITLLLATAVSLLLAQEKSKKQETAKVERPPVAAEIADGKRSEFGFISHAIDCPTYFAPHADRPGQKLIETIEVLLPDKMVPGTQISGDDYKQRVDKTLKESIKYSQSNFTRSFSEAIIDAMRAVLTEMLYVGGFNSG